MVKQEVTGHVIFNWKKKQLRIVKNRPKSVGPYDIPLTLNLKVIIPEMPEHELNVDIEVPPAKVAEIIAEEAFGDENSN